MRRALVIVCALAAPGALADPVTLSESLVGTLELSALVEVLPDEQGRWTIEDVTELAFNKRFTPNTQPVFNAGETETPYWYRLYLRGPPASAADTNWLIEIPSPFLDQIDIYLPEGNGGWRVFRVGELRPYSDRPVLFRNVVFPVALRAGETIAVYLRVQVDHSVQELPLRLWSKPAFETYYVNEMMFTGLFFGAVLVMVLYNAFIGFFARDRSSLNYVLVLLFLGILTAGLDGTGPQFLWGGSQLWIVYAPPVSNALAVLWCNRFTQSFLNTQQHTPAVHRLLNAHQGMVLLFLALMFFVKWAATTAAGSVLAGGFIALLLPAAGITLRQGLREARWVALSFGPLSLCIPFEIARLAGYLPATLFTAHLMQIAFLFTGLVLSLALADRINIERREKIAARTEAKGARELKSLNEKLKRLQEHRRVAAAATSVGVWTYHFNEDRFDYDDVLLGMHGLPLDLKELKFKDFFSSLHPDDQEMFSQYVIDQMESGVKESSLEYRVVVPGGKIRGLQGRTTTYRDEHGSPLRVAGACWDATDLMEARRALEERTQELQGMQERHHLATHAANMGVWVWDAAADQMEFDDSLKNLHGIAPDTTGLTAAKVHALIHPEDRERTIETTHSLLLSDATEFFFEYRVALADGRVRGLQNRGTITRDERGRAVRMAGASWDATELMKARRALEDSTVQLLRVQEQYRLATQSAGVGVWAWHLKEDRFEIDESLQAILGLPAGLPTDLKSTLKAFLAITHPDDRPRQRAVLSQAQLKQPPGSAPTTSYFDEFRIVRPNGEIAGIQSRGTFFWDENGDLSRAAGVSWDATKLMEAQRALERKSQELEQSNQALTRLEERYRLATRSANMGVWRWLLVEDRLEYDESLRSLFGFPEGALQITANTLEAFLSKIHPDDRRRQGMVLKRLRTGKGAPGTSEYFEQYRIVRPAGEVLGIHSRGTIFRDESGRAVYTLGAAWDATKLIETQRALEEKKRELERSNKELDDFTYIASHDLKEPLRGISNYAKFLQDDYAARLDDEGRNMLVALERQSKRLETLINELLNYSRLGRTELAVGDTDLNASLKEILDSLEFAIGEKNVEIRIPKLLPMIRCDSVRVGELFRNLITNAMKYNDKPEKWIEIGWDSNIALPAFHVRDNGIGIKPEHKERVFTMFKRLHAKDAYGGGTGVGLTIAQKIVQMHGGKLWLESQVGIGTAFYFTLNKAA